MKILLKTILLSILFTCTVNASTMFLLTKIDKAYLVVENYSSKLPMSIKKDILEEMKGFTEELKIDTSGYSHRTLAFILYDTALDGKLILNIDLVLGEEIKRIDDNEEVYGLTYEKRKQMTFTDKSDEDIQDELIEHVELLLNDFAEQYKEDNE